MGATIIEQDDRCGVCGKWWKEWVVVVSSLRFCPRGSEGQCGASVRALGLIVAGRTYIQLTERHAEQKNRKSGATPPPSSLPPWTALSSCMPRRLCEFHPLSAPRRAGWVVGGCCLLSPPFRSSLPLQYCRSVRPLPEPFFFPTTISPTSPLCVLSSLLPASCLLLPAFHSCCSLLLVACLLSPAAAAAAAAAFHPPLILLPSFPPLLFLFLPFLSPSLPLPPFSFLSPLPLPSPSPSSPPLSSVCYWGPEQLRSFATGSEATTVQPIIPSITATATYNPIPAAAATTATHPAQCYHYQDNPITTTAPATTTTTTITTHQTLNPSNPVNHNPNNFYHHHHHHHQPSFITERVTFPSPATTPHSQ